MKDALLFLFGYAPGVLDAVLTATESCPGDLSPALEDDSEAYCKECGVRAGVFAAYGSEWMHYSGDLATGDVRPYKAGHCPVVRWRPAVGEVCVAF